MGYKSQLLMLLGAMTICVLGATPASACQCMPKLTMLEQFDSTPNIIIGRAKGVEKAKDQHAINGIRVVTMEVVRVYKGTLKSGQEMVFAQGGGADCGWEFDADPIGQEFLLYLGNSTWEDNLWHATFCNRTTELDSATDDLLYLNNLNKVRGRTRLSGSVGFNGDEDLRAKGIKIRVIGESKSFVLRTDSKGVYEIYDIPEGTYLIEPEIPKGWKVLWPPKYDSPYELPKPKELPPPRENQVAIESKKHAELNFDLRTDNQISGTVYDPSGNRMNDVCLDLLKPDGTSVGFWFPTCTRADGTFSFSNLRRGQYLLVANPKGVRDPKHPYPTVYYPGVLDRARSLTLYIGVAEKIDGLSLTVPQIDETLTMKGVVLFADGTPAANTWVAFNAKESRPGFYDHAAVSTDEQGNFSLTILKGREGEIVGTMTVYKGQFVECPPVEEALAGSGDYTAQLRTQSVKAAAQTSVSGLVLKFPFPACKKAKN